MSTFEVLLYVLLKHTTELQTCSYGSVMSVGLASV